MSLLPGTRLGPYEILAPIGAGGMGQVYRARDTRLHRDVAIKVLPELAAADADSVARFEREAQTLASLNHPNIAIIHGFEESPGADGQAPLRALVLELVEGTTLAERIAHGRLPLDELLPIARQIAEACEAAHAQGIVHRDLKPANIKVRPDGTVKILDFGIAKLVSQTGGAAAPTDDEVTMPPRRPEAAAMAPTVTTPAHLRDSYGGQAVTMAGTILGTAAYMAPEQARGKPIDKRVDIWAFGCVLFEMLTGRRAFGGETVTDTLAFVLTREPDWTALSFSTRRPLIRLLRRCLTKDPAERLRDMGDARLEIKDALAEPAHEAAPPPPSPKFWTWRRVAGIAALVAAAGALGAAAVVRFQPRPAPARVGRFGVLPATAGSLLFSAVDRDVAIAPDGSRIAYIGPGGMIHLRALDRLEAAGFSVSGAPRAPFFSPDGQSIGFADGNILKRVPVTGGTPTVVCRLPGSLRGAAWLADDTIVFATSEPGAGLRRVAAGGGDPALLTTADAGKGEGSHAWPEVLPGRQAVLFTITSATTPSAENSKIGVFDLRAGTSKVVLSGGSDAHYVAGGFLVYGAAGSLRAVRFDLEKLEAAGNPAVALPQISITQFGAVNADTSNDGALLYVPVGAQTSARTLVWVDRDGREEATKVPARTIAYARLSPDGSQLALDIRDQENDIWIWNFARETLTRLTLDPATDRFPVWTPDGRRLFFGSDRSNTAGTANIFWQAVDGTGTAERLTKSGNLQVPMSVSPNGQTLVFRETNPSFDLMALSLDAAHATRPLVHAPVAELNAEISPDGRWMAYESNDSGQFEIFVRPFPGVDGGRWQISTQGGIQPLWSRNGQELFYLVPSGGLMSVRVDAKASWSTGTPAKLHDEHYYHTGGGTGAGRTYDVSLDGRRFLMIKPVDPGGATPGLVLVQNWREELARLVTTAK